MGGVIPNCQARHIVKLAKKESVMNITYVKIGLHQFNDSDLKKKLFALRDRYIPLALYQDENNYLAEAIEFQGHYFYRINGVTVEAEKYEYEQAINNPRLYYFSSALKLHHRVKQARELGLGLNWPTKDAAPINIFELGK
jgi:hypothetical protein